MSARDDILGRLKGTLDAGSERSARAAAVAARLADPPRAPLPGRVRDVDLAETFRIRAEEIGATTARVARLADVGAAIAELLRSRNLPSAVKTSPELAAWPLDWPATVTRTDGRSYGDDPVTVVAARAAVAETGTLMLTSGPETPTTLNFLPEQHIVVLPTARVGATYEQAWDKLRATVGADGMLPRTVNFITGPSRTADIEQTLLMGIHGPRNLHIILVDEDHD